MNSHFDHDLERDWQRCCQLLLGKMGQKALELNITPIRPLSYEHNTLTLGVSPRRVFRQWLEENYKPLIEEAFTEVTNEPCTVCFQDCQTPEEDAPAPAPAVQCVPRVAVPVNPLTERLNTHFTFDSFVVGDANRFAHSAALAVTNAPGHGYNPLFLHSNSGLGKSHLLNAIAWKLINERPGIAIDCLTSEEFCNRYYEALSRKEMPKFRNHFRNLDVLLVDDIQFFVGKKNFQEELFHTFNALASANRQIVITSDRPPRELDDMAERLVSRFEGGLTASIAPPDPETRLAILYAKQQAQGIRFPDKVLSHLASLVRSNVRRLEGALFNLVYSCTIYKIPFGSATTEFLDERLKDFLSEETLGPVSLEQIQKAVADHYALKYTDLVGKRRPANIAMPRQLAMYLSRKLTGLSLPSIADGFHRTHATVCHAIKSIEDKLAASPEMRREAEQIERSLRS